MGVWFQILGPCSHCSLNIERGEIRVVTVVTTHICYCWIFFFSPRHSFIGQTLDENWVGFVDKTFDQKNNLWRHHTHTHTQTASTKKLWRALWYDTGNPTVPMIAQGSISHSAFEGIESKWQFQQQLRYILQWLERNWHSYRSPGNCLWAFEGTQKANDTSEE